MRNKKSTISIDVMIYMAIGVVVFFVLLFIVPNLLGKSSDRTCGLLSSSKDYDGDGITNFFDKCPCDGTSGKEEYDGCATQDLKPTISKEECDKNIEAACKNTKEEKTTKENAKP